jgi:A/G-specific adenine glycosylase
LRGQSDANRGGQAHAAVPDFAARLIHWQKRHGRHDLPWQGTRDPYRIWLSEIMLQQTQVAAVIPYYLRFLERFPDLETLAAAPVSEVMSLWSGLGYYARARNLHRAAQVLVERHCGRFPREPAAIAALPGIGRSTAAAIAAFAFGKRAAILDGNVKRVLARCFGIEGFPGAKPVEDRLWTLAGNLLPARGIGAYTQALMDLGATVCTRGSPDCARCPLADACLAQREGRQAELPAPRPARALPSRSAKFLVLTDGGGVLLERRPPAGIWGGLLALPELPDGSGDPAQFALVRYGFRVESVGELPPMAHGFTHFRLEIRPLLCHGRPAPHAAEDRGLQWLPLDDLAGAALPAPIRRLLAGIAAGTGN